MTKTVLSHPVKLNDLSFDELYLEISDHWEEKARRLQARRWHKLRNEIKGKYFAKNKLLKLKL